MKRAQKLRRGKVKVIKLTPEVINNLVAREVASQLFINSTKFDTRVELNSTLTLNKKPPNSPPYKPRLEIIQQGLFELLNSQKSFQSYLNPQPMEGKTGDETAVQVGMDELISSIEHLINVNQLTFNDIRNKF